MVQNVRRFETLNFKQQFISIFHCAHQRGLLKTISEDSDKHGRNVQVMGKC